jgi:hypothetical protein
MTQSADAAVPVHRDELIHLLVEAAETEHMLCCQYLFAAFSLKREPSEGLTYAQQRFVHDWTQLLLLISRQEMEHLGLVSNLLTSVGAAPHAGRPNFPQGALYFPVPMTLEKFGEKALTRFITFERPEPPPGAKGLDGFPEYMPVAFTSIGQLYDRISWLIDNIPLSDAELFVGPAVTEVTGSTLHVDWPRPGALGGVFDNTLFAITDRKTAQRAIQLILSQGEGTRSTDEFTHFKWFTAMLGQLQALRKQDPKFEPARNVAENPVLYQNSDASQSGYLITEPLTAQVLNLFNGVYELLLLLLVRLYACTDEDADHVLALAYTMFPLMTQILRPVAELLTKLPVATGSALCAGPGFQISRIIHVLPHQDSAFQLLTERFATLGVDAQRLGTSNPPVARLKTIGNNMLIMAEKFSGIANGTYPQTLLVPGVVLPYQTPEA